MTTFRATKTYGHEIGLSCAFRQWRAESHCRFLHGYALAFRLEFEAENVDENGWVIDFGGLKPIKDFLVENFDHRLLVARDDPALELFKDLHAKGVADVLVLPRVGCEAVAGHVFRHVSGWLMDTGAGPRVRLVSVEVREHAGNSASALNRLEGLGR